MYFLRWNFTRDCGKMDNPGELMHLCRLCLVKDQVNIPIFEEQGDIRKIFVKISSCLPVKVSNYGRHLGLGFSQTWCSRQIFSYFWHRSLFTRYKNVMLFNNLYLWFLFLQIIIFNFNILTSTATFNFIKSKLHYLFCCFWN